MPQKYLNKILTIFNDKNNKKPLGKVQNIRDLEGGWTVLSFNTHLRFPMSHSQLFIGSSGLRIAHICQICNKKISTNQRPPLEVTWPWKSSWFFVPLKRAPFGWFWVFQWYQPTTLDRLKGFHTKNAKFTTHDLEIGQNSWEWLKYSIHTIKSLRSLSVSQYQNQKEESFK